MENTFDILKLCFCELMTVSDLHVTFFPDVVLCYCLLHSLLLGQSVEDMEVLLDVFHQEGMVLEVDNDLPNVGECVDRSALVF